MARLAAAGAGGIVAATTMRACTQSQSAPPSSDNLDVDGVGGQIYSALINRKVNACPMAIRVAWHASGT